MTHLDRVPFINPETGKPFPSDRAALAWRSSRLAEQEADRTIQPTLEDSRHRQVSQSVLEETRRRLEKQGIIEPLPEK